MTTKPDVHGATRVEGLGKHMYIPVKSRSPLTSRLQPPYSAYNFRIPT